MKKKLEKYSSFLMVISFTLVVYSCVGTVEDKNLETTKTAKASSSIISFSGIVKAKAVSHSKVEVYFLPAPGDQATLIYQVFVNNSQNPIKIKGDVLTKNPEGLYIYTVDMLTVNSTYSFKVGVVDNKGNQSQDKKSVFETTFSNKTCDFNGISSLTLPAGDTGKTSIKVEWVPGIKLGTGPIDIKSTDPDNYIITYISSVGGYNNLYNTNYSGADRKELPPISKDQREWSITGLSSGETYYVGVRCVHSAYSTNSSDSNYKKEENNKVFSLKTATNTGVFDFNPSGVSLKTPIGPTGRSAIDIIWEPATGDFNHYRLFITNVANNLIPDQITNDASGIENMISLSQDIQIIAEDNSYRATSLIPYAWYQIKMVACRTIACSLNDRIVSSLSIEQIVPVIAPFQGIVSIDNPRTSAALDETYLNFSPPTMTAGYASAMEVYCIFDKSDPLNSNIKMVPGVSTGALGNGVCDNLTVTAPFPFPTTEAALSIFTEVTVKGVDTVTPTEYCFFMLPVIDDGLTPPNRNLANAILKCTIPLIVPPTIAEFPGKDNQCVSAGADLPVTWTAPTSGIYDNYMVFWKERTINGFSFEDAKAQQLASGPIPNNTTCSGDNYCWATKAKLDLSHTITSLLLGETYQSGVLAFIISGSTQIFSENNINTSFCTVPLPIAKFTEWNHIISIGPKKNGLIPEGNISSPAFDMPFIPETLDADGSPIEIQRLSDGNNSTLDLEPTDNSINGLLPQGNSFDGNFGAYNGNPVIYTRHQYSNSGIIKLEWEDISILIGGVPTSFEQVINTYYPGGSAAHDILSKSQRTFGYKVYRSDDNKATWQDLTVEGPSGSFQRLTNIGHVLAEEIISSDSLRPRLRSNLAPSTSLRLATFTDYSVQSIAGDLNTERARIYWYKIVPIFNDKEISYLQTVIDPLQDDPEGHIIKVVLPPPNMALVHRKMANKTLCNEMNLPIQRGAGQHYSCIYKGLGASSLSRPWNTTQTVYDQGGDLMVDRFELGCNLTRGRIDSAGTLSDLSLASPDLFEGKSDSFQKFRGCFNPTGSPLSNEGDPIGTADRYTQAVFGDCLGSDYRVIAPIVCPSTTNSGERAFLWPGASSPPSPNCTAQSETAYSLDYGPVTAQSEYAATFYHSRSSSINNVRRPQPYIESTNNKFLITNQNIRANSCLINLPSVDNSGGPNQGKWTARWLPTNQIAGELSYGDWVPNSGQANITTTNIQLLDKTMGEVYSMPEFYDSTAGSSISLPSSSDRDLGRFDDNTPIVKVFSSNSSKLPPLEGFSQEDYYTICQQYKVEIGATNSSGNYFVTEFPKSKRILYRKEQIALSAWPSHYDESKIISIEDGTYSDSLGPRSCNSLGKTVTGSSSNNALSLRSTLPTIIASSFNPSIFTGSSHLDIGPKSDKCVSKFGIQDIVGNKEEVTADRIHCSFGTDKIFLGDTDNPLASIPYRSSGCLQRDALGVCIKTGYWNYNPILLNIWVQGSTESGECSAVQESGDRSSVSYINGVSMRSIFSEIFSSGVNESIITGSAIGHFDVASYDYLRNGDGFFLDFGSQGLSPRINREGQISIRDTSETLAKFFNPVIGFPLDCSGSTCNESLDNIKFINSDLWSKWSGSGYTSDQLTEIGNNGITNFPIGNSEIYNSGTSEIQVSETVSFDPMTSAPGQDQTIIIGIDASNNDLSFTGEDLFVPYPLNAMSSNKSVDLLSNDPNVPYTRTSWTIQRGAPLSFIVGGGSSEQRSGRYYLRIVGDTQGEQRSYYNPQGGRCALMINQDY